MGGLVSKVAPSSVCTMQLHVRMCFRWLLDIVLNNKERKFCHGSRVINVESEARRGAGGKMIHCQNFLLQLPFYKHLTALPSKYLFSC